MRVLLVTPRFPYPPHRGDTVRSWGVLRALAARHEVWLASVDTVPPAPEHAAVVRGLCRDVYCCVTPEWRCLLRGAAGLLLGRSLTEGYFGDAAFRACLRDWAQRPGFDAVITYSSSIAPAVVDLPIRRRLLDLGDVDSHKWALYARRTWPPARWFYALESRRVAALERDAAADHELCLLVNERERRKFARRHPACPTGVLRTTVDLDDYPGHEALSTEPVVSMVGSMFYPPNVRAVEWFGQRVWPRIRAAVPNARWLIVGSRPSAAVRAWARAPGVTVTGYVPDVRPYLALTRVFVNPVVGDIGVQSKVLVALAAGRPAVVTPDTAAGIDHEDPPPFVVATAPAEFAAGVVRLLRDDAWARTIGARARATAERYYSAAAQRTAIEGYLAAVGALPVSTTNRVVPNSAPPPQPRTTGVGQP